MSDPADNTRIRAELARIHADAEALAAQLGRDIAAVEEARESSNVDDEHDPEGSTIAYERSQLEAIRQSSRRRAVEAADALARLDAGAYGICVVCGRPIAPARLEARPMAARCLDCAA